MEDKIYSLIVEQQETTWKSIIQDMVGNGKLDPWDVDVSRLTSMYIEHVKSMQQADLKVSGKMLLAAALLLKMKSTRLVGEDLSDFDRLLAQGEMNEQDFYDGLEAEMRDAKHIPPDDMLRLIPRTPQARTRKVTIFDLVNALEKALETKHRRLIKLGSPEAELILPHKSIDINLAMKQIYKYVREYFTLRHSRQMKWSDLLPEGADREQKMYAFVPLLHLGTQRKLDIHQKKSFEDFDIALPGTFEEPEAPAPKKQARKSKKPCPSTSSPADPAAAKAQ